MLFFCSSHITHVHSWSGSVQNWSSPFADGSSAEQFTMAMASNGTAKSLAKESSLLRNDTESSFDAMHVDPKEKFQRRKAVDC